MATRKTPTPAKSSTSRKPASATRSTARSSSGRGRSPAPTSKTSRAGSGSRKSPSRSSRSERPSRGVRLPSFRLPGLSNLSLDRKLDFLGVGLSFLGLITLLSLLSSTRGAFLGMWVQGIRTAFGWGMYVLPLALILLGVWLMLRHFDRMPQLALERVIGLVSIYIALLASLHFMLLPANQAASQALAAAGQGGGYIGSFLYSFFQAALGLGGTSIALVAWFLVSIALTLDVSVIDLFAWVGPVKEALLRLANALLAEWQAYLERRSRRQQEETAHAGGLLDEDFSPLPPVSAADAQSGQAQPPASLETPEITHTWVLPAIEQILELGQAVTINQEQDKERAKVIQETLASFGAPANVIEINRGPTITQFGVEPAFVETRAGRTRVRVSKIAALADDLALALSAKRIRIQAPVPGKGYVGIEVPNEETAQVALRDVIESERYRRLKAPLRFALGKDVAGNTVGADLAAMPHLLIAGATGSGKSVCVNVLITCLLLNNTPDDLRFIMVDPKRVELTGYNGIPHLLAPVVVEMERVVGALQWVTREMDQRYHRMSQVGARNITEYNRRMAERGEHKLPHLVVMIDELADLMMLAPDETEKTIARLAQLARATGIHLVIATQRPSVDVVTGLIKANFPARIAFAVASSVDSRVILDQVGAERLLGRGDMLFQAPDAPAPVRLQGAYVSDAEIQSLVSYWRDANEGTSSTQGMSAGEPVMTLPPGIPLKQMPIWDKMEPEEELDPLYHEAVDLVRKQGRASISSLQRRMRIGYTRAARLVETMQAKGIVGQALPGAQGMEILDYGATAPPPDERLGD